MKLFNKGLLVSSSLLILSSCGGSDIKEHQSDYLSWGTSSVKRSTIRASREESIRVCMSGRISRDDADRATAWSTESLLVWLRALKVIDTRVTSRITYTCDNPHLTWNIRSGNGRANARPGQVNIYTARPFGTWSHELGHAFAGLSDTYAGGAGKCKSGQPLSLMCWGAYGPRADHSEYSTLWEDDILGVQANYNKVFRDEKTPADWADQVDLTAAIDPQNPWPTGKKFEPVVTFKDWNIEIASGLTATAIDNSGDILDF